MQKLTSIIQGSAAFTASAVSPIKSKKDVWSKASKKAWKVRKRLKQARAARAAEAERGAA